MAKRDAFLIRIDPDTLDAVRRWADDELRSVNAQIEFILRRALRDAGRLGSRPGRSQAEGGEGEG
jgi:hypothetical protein